MEPTRDNNPFAFPPALMMKLEAAADRQHRHIEDVVRDLVESGIGELLRALEPSNRVVFKMEDLSDDELKEITEGGMDPRHNHLNAELE